MVDITKLGESTAGSNPASTGSITGRNKAIGKEEFLHMLVTQLKHQDPTDPMKSDDFAVNLAQFSALEQLIAIKEKVGGDSSGAGSLASYLGNSVVTKGETVQVTGDNAGQLRLTLPRDATEVAIELLDASGNTLGTLKTGELKAGKHTVELTGLNGVPEGTYSYKVTATTIGGSTYTPEAANVGTVTGFIPGEIPTLLVGNREVPLSEITEVTLPMSAA